MLERGALNKELIKKTDELLSSFIDTNNTEIEMGLSIAQKVINVCGKVGQSWSKFPFGSHCKLYFRDYEVPDAAHVFSIEWGDLHGMPNGWKERKTEEVRGKIEELIGDDFSFERFEKDSEALIKKMKQLQNEAITNLSFISELDGLNKEKELYSELENFVFGTSKFEFRKSSISRGFTSRDSEAIMQGLSIPTHEFYAALGYQAKTAFESFEEFVSLAKRLITQLQLKYKTPIASKAGKPYVDLSRISELEELDQTNYNFKKLIQYCKELNLASENEMYFSIAMIVRSILNHVPPIFGFSTFLEVVNNYKGTKSFKEIIKHLEESCRKIADSYLHEQIRKKENLPNRIQVDFSANLDVLLSEVCRITGKKP